MTFSLAFTFKGWFHGRIGVGVDGDDQVEFVIKAAVKFSVDRTRLDLSGEA